MRDRPVRNPITMLDRLIHRTALRHWRSVLAQAPSAPAPLLRARRNRARALRAELDRLIHAADAQLTLPAIGATAFPRPHGTDWAWRPALWRGPLPVRGLASPADNTPLGDEIALFHDCRRREIALRQDRNQRPADLAPFGLCVEVFGSEASFLSLAVDLPRAAVQGLAPTHILRVDATLDAEAPQQVFLRLNIRQGPNTEQVVRALPLADGTGHVEFDMAYCGLDKNRVQALWLDVIFERPAMNRLTLRDLTFARFPRAHL